VVNRLPLLLYHYQRITLTFILANVVTRFEAIRTMSLVNPTLSYKDFKKVDMVIEAVFEDVKIKHAVIKEVEQVTLS